MKFNQIVVLENTRIPQEILDEFQEFSEKPMKFFHEDSCSDEETIERIGDADCILFAWRLKLSKNVLLACPNLKYVCLCATTVANIDLDQAKEQNIIVTNVHNYSDVATAEYVFAELLSFTRGFEGLQWKNKATDLENKKFGIVGLGPVGKEVARIALGFNMQVLYNSRTRKPEYEEKGLEFRELDDLLQEADIISLHTPSFTKVFEKKHFDLMKEKVLINTTTGKAFDEGDFFDWIKMPNTFAIMDQCPDKCFQINVPNVRFRPCVAAASIDSRRNLGKTALDNLKSVLESNPKNRVV